MCQIQVQRCGRLCLSFDAMLYWRRNPIERANNAKRAGQRNRAIGAWERDDLVKNLVTLLGQCEQHIQERMVELFAQCNHECSERVAEGSKLDYAKLLGETMPAQSLVCRMRIA